jgi:hypothetical protein
MRPKPCTGAIAGIRPRLGFVIGRCDAVGSSYPPHLKPGDETGLITAGEFENPLEYLSLAHSNPFIERTDADPR